MAKITQTNNAEPVTPPNGATTIYVDSSTKKLATKDDAGTVIEYGSGGGAGGLPVGGTAGQILEKVSATDFDAAWIAPSPSQQQKYIGFFSGFWYRTGTIATLSLAQAANQFTGGFFRMPETVVIDRLGVEATAAVTADYIVGIYEISEVDPNIGAIVYQTPVQSLVAASGPQEIVASFTLVKNKLYVFGIINDTAVTWRTANTGNAVSIGAISPQDTVSAGERWGGAFTFGTLTDFTTTSGITFRPPLVWFRKA